MIHPHEKSIVLFDGVCNLCNAYLNSVLRNDPKDLFLFAPLQSDRAQELLMQYGMINHTVTSVVLIENGKLFQRSTAVLRIARKMGGFFPLLYGFIIIPAFIRDFIYDAIARNRYRWWGKREQCMIPDESTKKKFLP
jgi:predicted DCC family thiol-disulfide oxidoreductase YuxK